MNTLTLTNDQLLQVKLGLQSRMIECETASARASRGSTDYDYWVAEYNKASRTYWVVMGQR